MSTPDVRVRLTAEGVKEVVDALKAVESQAGRAAERSTRGLTGLRSTIRTLGLTAAATGLIAFARSTTRMADEAGKAGERLGTTAEGISVLRAEADLANVGNEKLEQGLVNLTDSLGKLIAGTKEQTRAFTRLGLTVKDFDGLDTAESFALVADRVAKLGDSTAKTRAIIDIFGKRVGPQLIPLLNQLGEKGFAKAREEAERFGLVVDSATARAADAVSDSFSLIGAQARGVATQFLAGFAPTLATVMEDFRQDVAGKGVDAAKDFGKAVGETLRDTIFVFQFTGRAVGLFFANLVDSAQTGFAQAKALIRGAFEEAKRLQDELEQRKSGRQAEFDEDIDVLKQQRAASEERAKLLAAEAEARAEERKKLAAQLALLEKQQAADEAREKGAAEEKRKDAELDRALDDILKNEEKAGEARVRTAIELLELTGQERDAKIRALDEELRKRKEILAFAGQLTDSARAQLDRRRDVGVAQIDLEEAQAQGERVLEALRRARERIEQDVQLGVISELQGRERILAIEKERLVVLQQLAAAALAAAQATGSPEAIAQAEAFAAAVREVDVSVRSTGDSFARFKLGAADAFQGGLTDLLANVEDIRSLEDAFRSLANTVIQALQQIAAEILASQIQKSLFSLFGSFFGGAGAGAGAKGGDAASLAGGGQVHGPGTPTSDAIPAWLSDGEFVMRAAAVRKYGPNFMHALNAGRLQVQPIAPPRAPRFAEGGPIEFDAATKFDGRLQIGLDPGLRVQNTDYSTPEGMRVLIQQAGKYRNALRQALGV